MIKITGYKAKEGADLAIKALSNNDNICHGVAQAIYKAYSDDCRQTGRQRVVFRPNLEYAFSNGLVFRLFDDRSTPESREPAIEFYVAPEFRDKKAEILATAPELVEKYGLIDKDAIEKLAAFIQDDTSRTLDTTKAATSRTAQR